MSDENLQDKVRARLGNSPHAKRHTPRTKEYTLQLYADGETIAEIVRKAGINRTTLYRWVKAAAAASEKNPMNRLFPRKRGPKPKEKK